MQNLYRVNDTDTEELVPSNWSEENLRRNNLD